MLTFVRHGESVQNRVITHFDPQLVFEQANPPLTEIGLTQAHITGKFLATELPIQVWVSQLDRANQTLDQMRPFLPNARISVIKELNEKNEQVYGRRDKESLADFVKRVQAFLPMIEKQELLLIVGHSVFISVLTSLLLGEPIQEPLVYRNPNCAITTFVYRDRWEKLCHGNVNHIPIEWRTGVD